MEQPTAEAALKELEPLIGQWKLEAIPPGGEPWPGEAWATIEWHDSRAHVVERSTVEMPEAPNGIKIMGRFEDGGDTIAGRWEKAEDGTSFETDFELIYRRAG
jgi:hypothetical protein